jgi:hypothetical protein
MKIKTFLGLALCVCACVASAQQSGFYFVAPATNYVPAATTNSSVSAWTNATVLQPGGIQHPGAILNVQEFDCIGLQCLASPKSSVTSTSTFVFCTSMDGGVTFESKPSIRFPCVLNGLTGYGGGAVGVTGVTHIAIFSVENPSGSDLTNVTIKASLKAPKRLARQATQ